MSPENIIAKFIDKIGNEDFVQPKDLVNIGLFGSSASVRDALNKGVFSFLKVSPHRILISTDSVVNHLRTSLAENAIRGKF